MDFRRGGRGTQENRHVPCTASLLAAQEGFHVGVVPPVGYPKGVEEHRRLRQDQCLSEAPSTVCVRACICVCVHTSKYVCVCVCVFTERAGSTTPDSVNGKALMPGAYHRTSKITNGSRR